MSKQKMPETPEEWQFAVNAAEFYLGVDSAREYGLLSGGPKINIDRCQQVLRLGKGKGYKPLAMSELCKMFIGDNVA